MGCGKSIEAVSEPTEIKINKENNNNNNNNLNNNREEQQNKEIKEEEQKEEHKEEQQNKDITSSSTTTTTTITTTTNSNSTILPQQQQQQQIIDKKKEEDERKKTVAASVITSHITSAVQNKKLTKAQQEKQAKEDEERRLMEMFEAMNSKLRFITAKKLGRMDIQRIAAVEMIQIEWRAKIARKRAHERRLERERIRREKAAKLLQCAIRVYQAKKILFALQAERERLRREGAAIYIQCAWRLKSAKNKLFMLRVAWAAAIFLQCRWRIMLSKKELQKRKIERAASIQIQRRQRGILGRKLFFQLMREYHPHTFMVLLKTVSLSQGGAGAKATANVSMIATSFNIKSTNTNEFDSITQNKTGAKKLRRSSTVSGPEGENQYTLRSWTESKQIDNLSSPVWNEELTITNSSWNSQIVLTLLEHGRFGKHTVIGQTVIKVTDYPSLYTKGHKVELISIPMDLYTIPVKDSSGKEIQSTSASSIHATVWCSIRLPQLSYSMCGWVWRASGRLIGGGGQFKRRWMVLIDRMLIYYEDPYTLNTFKGALVLEDIISIVQEKRKDGPAIRLNCRPGSNSYNEHWTIRWDVSEPLYIQQMWERKLRRCLPLHATYTNQTIE